MNIALAALIVAVVTGLAVAVMLRVRSRAPGGGYFEDGDRAAGVFGVLATGFSVLLGFLIFLAFESYDASRAGAETEAITVGQQVETALLFPDAVQEDLIGGLVCYSRYVIDSSWPKMEAGTVGNEINPWAVAMFKAVEATEPASAAEESAYGKWLDQTSTREEARQHRIHGAVGVIPLPLWMALFFIAMIIFVFVLCFADSDERPRIQALLMGSVIASIATMLLLLNFLNSPFNNGVGGVQPDAMERTLELVDQALEITELELNLPCDEAGQPV